MRHPERNKYASQKIRLPFFPSNIRVSHCSFVTAPDSLQTKLTLHSLQPVLHCWNSHTPVFCLHHPIVKKHKRYLRFASVEFSPVFRLLLSWTWEGIDQEWVIFLMDSRLTLYSKVEMVALNNCLAVQFSPWLIVLIGWIVLFSTRLCWQRTETVNWYWYQCFIIILIKACLLPLFDFKIVLP